MGKYDDAIQSADADRVRREAQVGEINRQMDAVVGKVGALLSKEAREIASALRVARVPKGPLNGRGLIDPRGWALVVAISSDKSVTTRWELHEHGYWMSQGRELVLKTYGEKIDGDPLWLGSWLTSTGELNPERPIWTNLHPLNIIGGEPYVDSDSLATALVRAVQRLTQK